MNLDTFREYCSVEAAEDFAKRCDSAHESSASVYNSGLREVIFVGNLDNSYGDVRVAIKNPGTVCGSVPGLSSFEIEGDQVREVHFCLTGHHEYAGRILLQESSATQSTYCMSNFPIERNAYDIPHLTLHQFTKEKERTKVKIGVQYFADGWLSTPFGPIGNKIADTSISWSAKKVFTGMQTKVRTN
jgi:hypothetical protein